MQERRNELNLRWGTFSLIGIMMIAGLTGCGTQGFPIQQTKPISVLFIQSPPTSLAVNATANIYAAVENSPTNSLANYTVTCASTAAGACGSFSASDEGGAIVYTAPSAVPSGGTVTVTATAAADSTKTISGTITITPPIQISVTFSPPAPDSLQVNATVTLDVNIKNDTSANPEVTWTVSCGSGECGTINPTTTVSNAETGYTAPAAIPPGNTVTVTATSVADPTSSASATITILPQGATLANGTYVYQLSGSSRAANRTPSTTRSTTTAFPIHTLSCRGRLAAAVMPPRRMEMFKSLFLSRAPRKLSTAHLPQVARDL
jgi:hypothetical protein